jgi:hypothetical protein
MLIVWDTLLLPEVREDLVRIDPRASYWPRTHYQLDMFREVDPADWYISFARSENGIIWLIKYSEHSHVIYRS